MLLNEKHNKENEKRKNNFDKGLVIIVRKRGERGRNNNISLEKVIPHSIEHFTVHLNICKNFSYPIANFLDGNKEAVDKTSATFIYHLHFGLYCCLKSKCKNQRSKLKFHDIILEVVVNTLFFLHYYIFLSRCTL